MAAIPSWLLGRHVTTITVTGVLADNFGNLTLSTTGSLTGQLASVKIRSTPTKENISSVDSAIAHNVITEENSSLELEEILRLQGTQQVLPFMAANFTYMRVVFSRAGNTYTYWGSRGEFEDGIESKGKNTCRLSLDQIDIGIGAAFTLA